MDLPLNSPPASVCLLRLSAVGDISHTLPVLRTLQRHWPQTHITWIIGKQEYELVEDLEGVEFIIFDKARRWRAYADVRKKLRGRRFDLLLHMQMSLRASLISLFVNAPIKLGFDRERAKDLQWLFTNRKIAHREHEHVLESLLGFTDALGLRRHVLRWDIPIPQTALDFAEHALPNDRPILVISPCSSMAYRNWTVEGYAAVADYATEQHGLHVVLTGGRSAIERDYGERITALCEHPPINLIGQTTLKQLLAVLERAVAVIAPDSGPAHLATAVGTPVIGLYACTNPDRARPYLSPEYVVNKYPEAVQMHLGKDPGQLPWGTRVKLPDVMTLIRPLDVTTKLDALLTDQRAIRTLH